MERQKITLFQHFFIDFLHFSNTIYPDFLHFSNTESQKNSVTPCFYLRGFSWIRLYATRSLRHVYTQ